MKKRHLRRVWKRAAVTVMAALLLTTALSGCKGIRLDPKNPITITVWHYYNGAIMSAFDTMVQSFNDTVGAKEGIIVEGYGQGNVADLEQAVMASAREDVGSAEMPNIFASYADTAYQAERMGILADLGTYFTEKEQKDYISSYIDEGRIGLKGELRIFPIAKSTEVLMLNDTDWQPFAAACGLSYDSLSTMEGLAQTAKSYYEWTDARTPDTPNDGKSFYGRDSIANMFITASKEFGTEIFSSGGRDIINVDEDAMRKLWDCYYIPYISGYFSSYGRFRSDDTKLGDILCYVGSTSSAAYFPAEVTSDGNTYPIQPKILPVPHFENAKRVIVQQGAGMVVTKSTPEEEYASSVFLKWFTDMRSNVEFSALSGYMPVKVQANDYDTLMAELDAIGYVPDPITEETLRVALDEIKNGELYTTKAFNGGVEARAVLTNHLQDKCVADRETVKAALDAGQRLEDVVASLSGGDAFSAWLSDFKDALNATVIRN